MVTIYSCISNSQEPLIEAQTEQTLLPEADWQHMLRRVRQQQSNDSSFINMSQQMELGSAATTSSAATTKDDGTIITFGMWRAAILVALQSFLYGYIFACLNSCLVTGVANDGHKCFTNTDDGSSPCPPGTIYNDINLTTFRAQLATSLVVIGAWIGCALGSYPSEIYGRRKTILYNNILFIIGALLCSFANLNSLLIGRFISGMGVGLESVVVPVLLSEISSKETRGTLTLVHQVLLTLAIFFVSMMSYGFVTYVNRGWQYIQAGGMIPSLVQLVFFAYIPESPKWLVSHGQIEQAEKELVPLRPVGYDVKNEVASILSECTKGGDSTGASKEASWAEVLTHKKAMIIGCGLMFFQAMTGINSVIFYSTTIFGFAGFDQAILATASVGVMNFVMSIASTYLIDRQGRKVLLLIGTYTMLGALLILSIVLLTADDNADAQGVIAVIAVLIFVSGFSLGLGAVTWVVISEIMPTRLRTKAVSLFLSINWGCNLIIGLVTLSAINYFGGVNDDMTDTAYNIASKHGVAYLYLFFAICTFLCICFMHLLVPETKNITMEELRSGQKAVYSPVSEPLLNVQEQEF